MAHPAPTAAEREASEWLVLLDDPAVPRDEIARFQAWLAASEDNKAAWAEVSATWDKLGAVRARLPPSLLEDRRRVGAANDTGQHLRRSRLGALGLGALGLGAIAATAAAALVLVFAPILTPAPLGEGGSAFATEISEIRPLILDDGTRAELGPAAEMKIVFDAGVRRVVLEDGTGFFEVAADPARPFIVATRYGEVRIASGSVSVRVTDAGMVASVVEGAASCQSRPGRSLWSRLVEPRPALDGSAGQEFVVNATGAAVNALSPLSLDQRLAWRERIVAGADMPLAEAAAELTRFSGVTFAFSDRALAQERVSVHLDGADVEGFIALVEANLGARAEREPSGQILFRRR